MPPDNAPSRIGRYEIKGLIGVGGMGTLYLARDTNPNTNRLVALKLLNANLDSNELRERFAREARLLSALSHPNVVNIYDGGEHKFAPYIVMEYVRGETLAEKIKREAPMSLAEKLRLMVELCAGLAHVHDAGIIHRDIKPANLMVDQQGRLKLLDFGIARVSEAGLLSMAGGMRTHLNVRIGTPGYMAPEQIERGEVDRRSDLFAVGAVFYELLAYREAFDAINLRQVEKQVLQEQPKPLVGVVPGVDRNLEAIVFKALAKDPRRRYQDAAELEHAIEQERPRFGRSDASNSSGRVTPVPRQQTRKSVESRAEVAFQRAVAHHDEGALAAAKRFAVEALAEDAEHEAARSLLQQLDPKQGVPSLPPRVEPAAAPRPELPRQPAAVSRPEVPLPAPPPVTPARPPATPAGSEGPTTLPRPVRVLPAFDPDAATVVATRAPRAPRAAPAPQEAALPSSPASRAAPAPQEATPPSSPASRAAESSIVPEEATVFIQRRERPPTPEYEATVLSRPASRVPLPSVAEEATVLGMPRTPARVEPAPVPPPPRAPLPAPEVVKHPATLGSPAPTLARKVGIGRVDWQRLWPRVAAVSLVTVFTGVVAWVVLSFAGVWGPARLLLTINRPAGGTLSFKGISCGSDASDCSASFSRGETIELVVSPDEGYRFTGFTGDCAPAGRTTMQAARTCGATFEKEIPGNGRPPGTVVLSIAPPTGGTLYGNGIFCGTQGKQCESQLPIGTTVGLEAQADKGFTLNTFTGDCANGGRTQMIVARTCGAIFAQNASRPPADVAGPGGSPGSKTPTVAVGTPGNTPPTPGPTAGRPVAPGPVGAGPVGGGQPGTPSAPATAAGPGGIDPPAAGENKPTPIEPPPAPPVVTKEEYARRLEEAAKKQIGELLEHYRTAYEGRNYEDLRGVFPNAGQQFRDQFKSIKSLKYAFSGPPKYVQLDPDAGTGLLEVQVQQTTETLVGKRPPVSLLARITVQKRGADNQWVIASVAHTVKP